MKPNNRRVSHLGMARLEATSTRLNLPGMRMTGPFMQASYPAAATWTRLSLDNNGTLVYSSSNPQSASPAIRIHLFFEE